MDNIIRNAEKIPKWMTLGKTILCQKDPIKGNADDNYRPISCLPLMWKGGMIPIPGYQKVLNLCKCLTTSSNL